MTRLKTWPFGKILAKSHRPFRVVACLCACALSFLAVCHVPAIAQEANSAPGQPVDVAAPPETNSKTRAAKLWDAAVTEVQSSNIGDEIRSAVDNHCMNRRAHAMATAGYWSERNEEALQQWVQVTTRSNYLVYAWKGLSRQEKQLIINSDNLEQRVIEGLLKESPLGPSTASDNETGSSPEKQNKAELSEHPFKAGTVWKGRWGSDGDATFFVTMEITSSDKNSFEGVADFSPFSKAKFRAEVDGAHVRYKEVEKIQGTSSVSRYDCTILNNSLIGTSTIFGRTFSFKIQQDPTATPTTRSNQPSQPVSNADAATIGQPTQIANQLTEPDVATKENTLPDESDNPFKSGTLWKGRCSQAGRRPYSMTLKITSNDGNTFEGVSTFAFGQARFRGKIEGSNVSFTEYEKIRGRVAVPCVYKGKLTGDLFEGAWFCRSQSAPFSVTRQAR